MSGINRFLSRRDKHNKHGHQEKVMSPPMSSEQPTLGSSSRSSFRTSSGPSTASSISHKYSSSSSSLLSLSLAFSNVPGKRSPRLQAVQGIVHSSTAHTNDYCLLQPKQTSGYLHGLFNESEDTVPEKPDEAKGWISMGVCLV